MPPFLLRSALLVLAALAAGAPRLAADGGSRGPALLLVDPKSKFHATDEHMAHRLGQLGFAVTVSDAQGRLAAPPAGGLILVSATVGPRRLEGRYRDVALPIVTWNPDSLPDLEMTGDVKGADFGTDPHGPQLYESVVNAPHPLAGGLPNGLRIVYSDSLFRINWGRPGLGATIICVKPGLLKQATLFAYEKGALMNHVTSAPARRVMLFLAEETFDQLTDEGMKLVDAAILWASAPPPAPGSR